ncbi:MAG: hypothetical protein R3E79_48855 [Caldilineaceae bacterium]
MIAMLGLALHERIGNRVGEAITHSQMIVEHPASDWFTRQHARERLETYEPLPISAAPPQDVTDPLERIVAPIVADATTRLRSTVTI